MGRDAFFSFSPKILFLRQIEILLFERRSNEGERNSISTFACGPVCCPDDADVDSGGKGRLSWGCVPLDSALSVVLGLARCLEAVARRTAHSHARACAAQAQTQSCSGCGSGKGGVPDGRAGTGTDMRRVCQMSLRPAHTSDLPDNLKYSKWDHIEVSLAASATQSCDSRACGGRRPGAGLCQSLFQGPGGMIWRHEAHGLEPCFPLCVLLCVRCLRP